MTLTGSQSRWASIVLTLAQVNLDSARLAVRDANTRVTDYVLSDVSTHYVPIAMQDTAKEVRWTHWVLNCESGSVSLCATELSTLWIYPDTDLVLPDTTLISRE